MNDDVQSAIIAGLIGCVLVGISIFILTGVMDLGILARLTVSIFLPFGAGLILGATANG